MKIEAGKLRPGQKLVIRNRQLHPGTEKIISVATKKNLTTIQTEKGKTTRGYVYPRDLLVEIV